MSEIKWQAPPPMRGGNASKHDAFRDALSEHPGEWAVFTESAKNQSVASNITRGMGKWGNANYEATSRVNGDGTLTIYVRLRPEPAEGES